MWTCEKQLKQEFIISSHFVGPDLLQKPHLGSFHMSVLPPGNAVHGAPSRKPSPCLWECWIAGAAQAAPPSASIVRSGPHEVSEPG